jgi:hypothetical protein
MESIPQKIGRSRQALRRHAHTWLGRTAGAGKAFAGETGEAGRAFWRFLDREARAWREYAWARGRLAAERRRNGRIRMPLARPALERETLLRVSRALEAWHRKVEQRLELLEPANELDAFASMSARELVAKLDGLSVEQLQSLHRSESEGKKRATVIRAIEQRLG